ncbi:hypothetical protein AVEN_106192-1 [Araneus ventricosus]|uniref:Uncharacterized protein n=1 Tax=Araneus ventricosus TaxID=182803 RepID=A0A4Y2TNH3_ARAVE|nr:hypothetical protein AVEN_106192-1 [Araneus ventricosus]
MRSGQEEMKDRMEKGQEEMKKGQEEMKNQIQGVKGKIEEVKDEVQRKIEEVEDARLKESNKQDNGEWRFIHEYYGKHEALVIRGTALVQCSNTGYSESPIITATTLSIVLSLPARTIDKIPKTFFFLLSTSVFISFTTGRHLT